MRTDPPRLLITPLAALLLACALSSAESGDEASTGTDTAPSDAAGTTTQGETSASEGDTESDTEGEATDTEATDTEGSAAADGSPCVVDLDCLSQLCLKYRDHDPQATCAAAPEEGRFRLAGTLLDISTGEPLAGPELRVLDGLTALQNPGGAPILLSAIADGEGRVDAVSDEPIAPGIGLVGLVVGEGLTPTSNALAVPLAHGPYGRTNTFHDLWVAPTPVLESWSALLQEDPEAAPHLPLGPAGGVVGVVREGATGTPLPGVTVAPLEPPSGAVIRYLNATRDGFNGDESAAHGLFVILGPGVGERFVPLQDGVPVDSAQGQARDAPGSISTLVLELP